MGGNEKKYLNTGPIFHWALRKSPSCVFLVYLWSISALIKPAPSPRPCLQVSYGHTMIRTLLLSALVAGGKRCLPEAPSCSHCAQCSGYKKAGAKFRRSSQRVGFWNLLGSFQKRNFLFGVWVCGQCSYMVLVTASWTHNPFSFHSSQLWAPHIPASPAQSGWR